MDTNKIITYSLLAHINNNFSNRSIKDLSEIFIPLVKKVISNLYQEGITKGLINDLKKKVDETYFFDMPYPMLVKIVSKIAYEANQDQNNVFIFYNNDHSFMIKKFIFSEYEEFISKQTSEIGFLEDAYRNYLIAQKLDLNTQPTIFDFLDKNRFCLSQFFAKRIISHIDSKYLVQAQFINSIKDNVDLYNILKRIYLGSIIATYLEADYGNINDQDVEFLLDTNFIVSMLDLHSPEATHTCLKIVELCRKFGYKLKTLNFTIQETKALLERTADELQNVRIFTQLDTDSIENACHRRKLNKTDLEKITFELEKTLRKDFGIHIITDKNILREKAKGSEIYKKLQARKINPAGSLHDATAIIYVQERRGKEIHDFNEANCWFVIDSRKEYVKFIRKDGRISEIIRTEDLVNILWLANPSVDVEEIAEIGLTQLVSVTINNSLPNPFVLKELDENIQKYAMDKIEPTECIRLASNVASQTVINMEKIEELNRTANRSPVDFVNQLKEYAEKLKIDEKARTEATNIMLSELKKDLLKQIQEKEKEFKKSQIKEIASKEAIIAEKAKRMDGLRSDNLQDLEESYNFCLSIKQSCDDEVKKSAIQLIRLIAEIYILEILFFIYLIKSFSWTNIAPCLGIISLVSIAFPWFYFVIFRHEFSPIKIYKNCLANYRDRIYKKRGFNIEYLNKLKKRMDEFKKQE